MGKTNQREPLTKAKQFTEPVNLEDSAYGFKPAMDTLKTICNKPHDKCEICTDAEPNSVIMECGHGGICIKCSIEILKKNNSCRVCKKKIGIILVIEPNDSKTDFVKVIGSIDANGNYYKRETMNNV